MIEISAENSWARAFYAVLGEISRKARKVAVRNRRRRLNSEFRGAPTSAATATSSDSFDGAPLIYDVGMSNGDDTEYYLEKGYKVIGIEANPELCKFCAKRFSDQVALGRLRIVNCAVGDVERSADFFINQENLFQSTLLAPETSNESNPWRAIRVEIRKLSSLIRANGAPYFVKIDVERLDAIILRDLMDQGIRPPFISAESHVIDVFCYLVAMGYTRFKLVDGSTVQADFAHHPIQTIDGRVKHHSFKLHSSGPFGEDIPGPWISQDHILGDLLAIGLGWVDIHATR